jgi:hypothetical protein
VGLRGPGSRGRDFRSILKKTFFCISPSDVWRAVIQREGFDWKQYLDKGGSFAHQLSINEYPTNFLLDEKGVIVKRNIMPAELEKMLDGL